MGKRIPVVIRDANREGERHPVSTYPPQQKEPKTPGPQGTTAESHEAAKQSLLTEVDVLHTLVNEYKARDEQNSRLQRRNFWLGVVTAFLVFSYTTVAALQLRAMVVANGITAQAAEAATSSARTAREALEIAEAADVELDGVQCEGPVGAGSIITLRFKNSGRTSADDFRMTWGFDVPDLPRGGVVGPISIAVVIAAGSVQESTAPITIEQAIGTNRVAQILDGTMPLGISGEFSYVDKFSHVHAGTFVLHYRVKTLCSFDMTTTSSKGSKNN